MHTVSTHKSTDANNYWGKPQKKVAKSFISVVLAVNALRLRQSNTLYICRHMKSIPDRADEAHRETVVTGVAVVSEEEVAVEEHAPGN